MRLQRVSLFIRHAPISDLSMSQLLIPPIGSPQTWVASSLHFLHSRTISYIPRGESSPAWDREHDGPRRVLQRVHFTTACNRGQKPGGGRSFRGSYDAVASRISLRGVDSLSMHNSSQFRIHIANQLIETNETHPPVGNSDQILSMCSSIPAELVSLKSEVSDCHVLRRCSLMAEVSTS